MRTEALDLPVVITFFSSIFPSHHAWQLKSLGAVICIRDDAVSKQWARDATSSPHKNQDRSIYATMAPNIFFLNEAIYAHSNSQLLKTNKKGISSSCYNLNSFVDQIFWQKFRYTKCGLHWMASKLQ